MLDWINIAQDGHTLLHHLAHKNSGAYAQDAIELYNITLMTGEYTMALMQMEKLTNILMTWKFNLGRGIRSVHVMATINCQSLASYKSAIVRY
jgi:hypothetical protein